jgi:membrane protease YdiL (CAAX protease family)
MFALRGTSDDATTTIDTRVRPTPSRRRLHRCELRMPKVGRQSGSVGRSRRIELVYSLDIRLNETRVGSFKDMTVAVRDELRGAFRRDATSLYYLAGYYVSLIAAWVGAWYLHDLTPIRDLSPRNTFAYWTFAKLIVWIAPILLIVTCGLKRSPLVYLGLVRFRRGAGVGLAVGFALVALMAIIDAFTRSHALPSASWGTLNAWLVAPVFEEVVFRGFALTALEESGCPFWSANAIAAILFLGLHLPGWHFAGRLGSSTVITALSVVVVGVVAGYAKRRSDSTWASVTVHFLNNAYSAFLR